MQKSETKNSSIEAPDLLPSNKSRDALKNLEGWQSTDDHKMIYREYIFHDFMSAVDMIEHIAKIAEDVKHHPDLHLTQYRNLRVALTTHDVGGLSNKDFDVATRIADLPYSKEHQKLQNKKQAKDLGLNIKTPPKKSKPINVVTKKSNKTKRTQAKKVVNRMNHHIKKS